MLGGLGNGSNIVISAAGWSFGKRGDGLWEPPPPMAGVGSNPVFGDKAIWTAETVARAPVAPRELEARIHDERPEIYNARAYVMADFEFNAVHIPAHFLIDIGRLFALEIGELHTR